MKNHLTLIILTTILVLSFDSCSKPEDADYLPVLPRFSSNATTPDLIPKGIVWVWPEARPETDLQGCEDQASLVGPILKGLEANTIGARVGDSIRVEIIGYSVVLTSSQTANGFTLTGSLPGDTGIVVLRFEDNFLYYHQELLVDLEILPDYSWYVSADYIFTLSDDMARLSGSGTNRFPSEQTADNVILKKTSNEIFIDERSYLMLRDDSLSLSKSFTGNILKTYDLSTTGLRAIVDTPSSEFVNAAETGVSAMYRDASGYWYMVFYTYGENIEFNIDSASTSKSFTDYSGFKNYLLQVLAENESVEFITPS